MPSALEFFTLKSIFHCYAKPFELGTFASPNTKDINMLVSFALGNTNFSRHPTQNPKASQWNIGCVRYQTPISCVGHVHFIFFALISFAFGTKRKPCFQWNMGFTCILFLKFTQKRTENLPLRPHVCSLYQIMMCALTSFREWSVLDSGSLHTI